MPKVVKQLFTSSVKKIGEIMLINFELMKITDQQFNCIFSRLEFSLFLIHCEFFY